VPAQTLRFAAHKDYPVGGYGPSSIAVGDINGDSRQDLAVANSLGDSVAILLGNADGSFQAPRVVYLGPNNNPRSIAIGDFNRDSLADLVVANPTSNTVAVLPGRGDATFQPVVTLTAGTSPGSVAVGDFNGDGNPDVAVANMGSNDVSV
jgi:predicted nucleotidyltransferase